MYELYDYADSGNGYKARLLLALLGIPYIYHEQDIIKGETRTPEFLAMNPNGRIPLLYVGDGEYLPESNAILHYLADGTDYLPNDRLAHARVLQWMFFEQYNHEPSIAVARFITRHLPEDHARRADLPSHQKDGHAALSVMEQHLWHNEWLAGDTISIADISLFAYTHVADDGGVSLDDYPHIRRWVDQIKGMPSFVPLKAE